MPGKAFWLLCIVALILHLMCCKGYACGCAGMGEYWIHFRQAIILGEPGKVASMTRFPFRVGGILDSDPVLMHDRKTFPRILARLLMQKIIVVEGGNKMIEKTMLQHVQDKKSISAKDYNSPAMVTVELFDFECINGKWLFAGAYLEE